MRISVPDVRGSVRKYVYMACNFATERTNADCVTSVTFVAERSPSVSGAEVNAAGDELKRQR